MNIRDVSLHFDRMTGVMMAYIGTFAICVIVCAVMGEYSLLLGYFLVTCLTLFQIQAWLGKLIARRMFGDPMAAFPKMYGELFAHPPVQIDYRLDFDNYLTAICYDGEFLYIVDKNKMVTLKWSDVRSWSWEIIDPAVQVTTANTPGLAVQGAVNDAWANLGPRVNAIKSSGIRLTVKDVNHPQWFYNTGKDKKAEAVCRKWEEIFRQFSDGSLKIAA
ncbi:hypothetical protein AA12717_3724 [Gluconacetobacter sacchari DSM 12717]|uniref:Uncharacterized protein n=2 Tax=Gluconacetobacter sacchari TaxID=92759 RepID=A0A7W4IA05_9PROT|nr:hypothetical protein [Gluconacetobacter sacchari]MBB2158960.1 hypothetical protein [Gluconacetobacter sacchari]GBQ31315.1 hypothetical protein AA12717_3724 [Gluconacetobacter sacchari DSM 12717]